MKNKNFIKGLVAGFLIPIAIIMVLALFNVGNIGNLLQSTYLLQTKSLKSLDFTEKTNGAIKGMMEELDDPYSYYMNPKEFNSLMEEVNGTYVGIGIYISQEKDSEFTTIMSPIKGTPAFDAGLLAGDKIISINGKSMSEKTPSEVSKAVKDAATKTIHIEISRDKETKEFDVKRTTIDIPTVDGQYIKNEDGIAYISISQFNDVTPTDLKKTIAELQKTGELKGIVLDVRNNPGGSVPGVVEVAQTFLPADDYILWVLEKSDKTSYKSKNTNPLSVPMVMLINENSASASEILAGALKDNGVATLVGTTTYGKGIIQTVYSLRDGGAVKITTAQYLSPKKHKIHKVGVKPDVKVKASSDDPLTIYSVDATKDNQLSTAISELKKKMQ
ncbi:MAG: S41 family peptidase [Clostridiales bacterium]